MPHLDVVEPSVIGNNCIILTVTKIGVEPVEVDDINGHGVENENKPDPPPSQEMILNLTCILHILYIMDALREFIYKHLLTITHRSQRYLITSV